MALGKSFKLGFLLRIADTCCTFGFVSGDAILPLTCFLRWPLRLPFVGNLRGNANMESEANKMVEATKIIPVLAINSLDDKMAEIFEN